MVCAADDNVLGENINKTIKKNAWTVLELVSLISKWTQENKK
jgi:hypothetical protein